MLKKQIKELAAELGFHSCGFAKAEVLDKEKEHLHNWLNKRMHGEMKFMENHFEKRCDPTQLMPSAETVIVFLLNYYTDKKQKEGSPVISKYAFGSDYHYLIKSRLSKIEKLIKETLPESESRCFVDSAPILEKAWAVKAGLGWIGKNSLLITPNKGSFNFIGTIITTAELEPDKPFEKDLCGCCTKCLNTCPTNALISPRVLDSNKCISYLTIEYRKELPEKSRNKFQNRMFGCDICQDVCPWNSKANQNNVKEFTPQPSLLEMNKENWQNLTRSEYKQLFKHSAVERTGYKNFKRNIDFLA